MYYGLNSVPTSPNGLVGVLPAPQGVTAFGEGAFREVIEGK